MVSSGLTPDRICTEKFYCIALSEVIGSLFICNKLALNRRVVKIAFLYIN